MGDLLTLCPTTPTAQRSKTRSDAGDLVFGGGRLLELMNSETTPLWYGGQEKFTGDGTITAAFSVLQRSATHKLM